MVLGEVIGLVAMSVVEWFIGLVKSLLFKFSCMCFVHC